MSCNILETTFWFVITYSKAACYEICQTKVKSFIDKINFKNKGVIKIEHYLNVFNQYIMVSVSLFRRKGTKFVLYCINLGILHTHFIKINYSNYLERAVLSLNEGGRKSGGKGRGWGWGEDTILLIGMKTVCRSAKLDIFTLSIYLFTLAELCVVAAFQL